MALIKCPNCGKDYSEHADKCPKCGLSIAEANGKKGCKAKTLKMKPIIWVSALLVVGLVVFMLTYKSQKETAGDIQCEPPVEGEEYTMPMEVESVEPCDVDTEEAAPIYKEMAIQLEKPFGFEDVEPDILAFLNTIYPSDNVSHVNQKDVCTERFLDYAAICFDCDAVYLSQEQCLGKGVKTRFEKSGDLYKVTLSQNAVDKVIVVQITNINGEYKIDNVGTVVQEDGTVLLYNDYSKQPEFIYDETSYSDEIKEMRIRKYGHLPR